MSAALQRYARLLDDLLWRRGIGEVDEDTEEQFAVALNDCRREMRPEDEAQIPQLVARRKAAAVRASLNLVDLDPPLTDDQPLRRTA